MGRLWHGDVPRKAAAVGKRQPGGGSGVADQGVSLMFLGGLHLTELDNQGPEFRLEDFDRKGLLRNITPL